MFNRICVVGTQAGSLWVNCHNTFDAATGFGGYKESGCVHTASQARVQGQGARVEVGHERRGLNTGLIRKPASSTSCRLVVRARADMDVRGAAKACSRILSPSLRPPDALSRCDRSSATAYHRSPPTRCTAPHSSHCTPIQVSEATKSDSKWGSSAHALPRPAAKSASLDTNPGIDRTPKM